jgi:hypothetical protein
LAIVSPARINTCIGNAHRRRRHAQSCGFPRLQRSAFHFLGSRVVAADGAALYRQGGRAEQQQWQFHYRPRGVCSPLAFYPPTLRFSRSRAPAPRRRFPPNPLSSQPPFPPRHLAAMPPPAEPARLSLFCARGPGRINLRSAAAQRSSQFLSIAERSTRTPHDIPTIITGARMGRTCVTLMIRYWFISLTSCGIRRWRLALARLCELLSLELLLTGLP